MRPGIALAAIALPLTPLAAQDEAEPAEEQAEPVYGEDWHNEQQLALSRLLYSDGWYAMPGGLKWRRIAGNGAGEKPTVENRVTVHYAGSLVDGTTFDSSYDRGEPATFPLSRLVKAWQLVIPQMAVGDTVELYAPADLAYGPRGRGPIPGNATLKFKVELLGFE